MKTEISAGGLVVSTRDGAWHILLLQDMRDAWTFPKGKVNSGEDILEAAAREIAEEVGLTHVTKLMKFPVVRYMYRRAGLISKTVHYFLFEAKGDEPLVNQAEEGIHNAQWVPLSDAPAMIGYKKTNMQLLEQALAFLSSYGH